MLVSAQGTWGSLTQCEESHVTPSSWLCTSKCTANDNMCCTLKGLPVLANLGVSPASSVYALVSIFVYLALAAC